MNVEIKDKDRGLEKMKRALMSMPPAVVEVGILNPEAKKQHRKAPGTTIAGLIGWHEFGVGVPRRSVLRDWFDQNKTQNVNGFIRLAKKLRPESPVEVRALLDRFGLSLVEDLKARWRRGIPPPNAPATIKRKGSSTPLIDTHQSINSVSHRVK